MMPETKPDLSFKNGICNACINFNARDNIDWQKEKQLQSILKTIKINLKIIGIVLFQ